MFTFSVVVITAITSLLPMKSFFMFSSLNSSILSHLSYWNQIHFWNIIIPDSVPSVSPFFPFFLLMHNPQPCIDRLQNNKQHLCSLSVIRAIMHLLCCFVSFSSENTNPSIQIWRHIIFFFHSCSSTQKPNHCWYCFQYLVKSVHELQMYRNTKALF